VEWRIEKEKEEVRWLEAKRGWGGLWKTLKK